MSINDDTLKDTVERDNVLTRKRNGSSSLQGARGWMTTWWRPDLERIRAEIAAEAELELEVKVEASDGDGVKQGAKRKRAPPTKGPCEHGVKPRSACKVCSACPHGRRRSQMQGVRWGINLRARSCRSQCKECGGGAICEHGRERSSARSAVGHKSASTVVYALNARSAVGINLRARSSALSCARSAVGHKSASTVVSALHARSAVGVQSASTVVSAISARSAVGLESASTVVSAIQCKECGGSSICEHGRQRPQCKECIAAKTLVNIPKKRIARTAQTTVNTRPDDNIISRRHLIIAR